MAKKRGDRVYTPDWAARDMVEHFRPQGRILEPCRGDGVFMRYLPANTFWCEVDEGLDFFTWKEPVDWIVGNPPYSLTRKWFRHSYQVSRDIVYLVPMRNVFSGYGFLEEIHDYGGIVEMRLYGTGSKLGFPMGNAVGAMHLRQGYQGPTAMTFHEDGRSAP